MESLHSSLLPNAKFHARGKDRAMKDIVMLNPVITIITPIPEWLHPPHRFECVRVLSRMFSEEITRTQKECIQRFAGSIDAPVHRRGATIRKHVISGMPL